MLPRHTLRQVLVISGLTLCSLSDGFIFGQMSGMVDALRGKDSEIVLSDDNVSWIASLINVTCICGFGLVAMLSEKLGRRHVISILTVPVLISYIMIYFARELTTFIISRIIVGVSFGGILILTYIAMAEYTNPNKRAIFINFVSALGPSLGTVLGHILSILLHWRTVALIGLIPTGISALLPLFWVESPSWLASQGRFEECKKAFRSIRGTSKEAEAELHLLIETESKLHSEMASGKENLALTVAKFGKAMKQKYFWKLLLLALVINLYRLASGRLMFSTLAITMLQEMTGSSNILLFTLIVDGFFILGCIFSFFALHLMRMRPLIFSLGLVANVTLVALSACLFFIPRDNDCYAWINISLLALYFITVCTGPYAVLDVYLSEIFPLDIKLFIILFINLIIGVASFLSIYLAPMMFATIGYHGVFVLNASIVFACLTYLWFFMPETKGRTLQQIELFFKQNKFYDLQDTNNEQAAGLL